MRQLRALLLKEFLVLARDRHALALLFLMPVVFIVCVSFALRDVYLEKIGGVVPVVVDLRDEGPLGERVRSALARVANLRLVGEQDGAVAEEIFRSGVAKAVVVVPEGFSDAAAEFVDSAGTEPFGDQAISYASDPALDAAYGWFLRMSLTAAVQHAILEEFGGLEGSDILEGRVPDDEPAHPGEASEAEQTAGMLDFELVRVEGLSQAREAIPHPLQHSVPAWSLFAMFFIAQPMASHIIKERQSRTLTRALVSPVSRWSLLLGKLLPYFVINNIQFHSMLIMGLWVVPGLIGIPLTLGPGAWMVVPATLVVSLAATGFGLLVSSLARSQAQVSAFVAPSIIVMAAVGGIMVPTFVMPPVMQRIGQLSPLNWGLEAYLDIVLRGAGFAQLVPEMASTLVFAGCSFAIALWRVELWWS